MTRLLFFYLIAFVIYSIHTQQYFVSNQDYVEYAQPYSDTTTKTIKVAYPLNQCTKTGNHISDALHTLFQCSTGGQIIWGCENTEALCMTGFSCDGSWTGTHSSIDISNSSSNETCEPGRKATTTINYMEVTFYCGLTTDLQPTSCPFDSSVFSPKGITRLATNVCVEQTNGDFYMAKCDNVSAQIGVYDSSACDNQTDTYRTYMPTCENYAYPDPSGDACNYFRKVSACMVNGNNILLNTTSPTNDPSETPSLSPSIAPITSATIEGTETPTKQKPDQTVVGAGVILSGLDNLTLMCIVCSIIFVFFLFICLYIWINERRKRSKMKSKFQKQQDADERAEYRRKLELQQRMEIQQQAGIYGAYGDYGDYDYGAQVDYHQMDEAAAAPGVKPVDVQLLQEGM